MRGRSGWTQTVVIAGDVVASVKDISSSARYHQDLSSGGDHRTGCGIKDSACMVCPVMISASDSCYQLDFM